MSPPAADGRTRGSGPGRRLRVDPVRVRHEDGRELLVGPNEELAPGAGAVAVVPDERLLPAAPDPGAEPPARLPPRVRALRPLHLAERVDVEELRLPAPEEAEPPAPRCCITAKLVMSFEIERIESIVCGVAALSVSRWADPKPRA